MFQRAGEKNTALSGSGGEEDCILLEFKRRLVKRGEEKKKRFV